MISSYNNITKSIITISLLQFTTYNLIQVLSWPSDLYTYFVQRSLRIKTKFTMSLWLFQMKLFLCLLFNSNRKTAVLHLHQVGLRLGVPLTSADLWHFINFMQSKASFIGARNALTKSRLEYIKYADLLCLNCSWYSDRTVGCWPKSFVCYLSDAFYC